MIRALGGTPPNFTLIVLITDTDFTQALAAARIDPATAEGEEDETAPETLTPLQRAAAYVFRGACGTAVGLNFDGTPPPALAVAEPAPTSMTTAPARKG